MPRPAMTQLPSHGAILSTYGALHGGWCDVHPHRRIGGIDAPASLCGGHGVQTYPVCAPVARHVGPACYQASGLDAGGMCPYSGGESGCGPVAVPVFKTGERGGELRWWVRLPRALAILLQQYMCSGIFGWLPGLLPLCHLLVLLRYTEPLPNICSLQAGWMGIVRVGSR